MGVAIVYFAAPLFTQAERRWNERLDESLRAAGFEVFLPQREAAPLIAEFGVDANRLFARMQDGLRTATLVVAILDGADADSGSCWECGYAFALGIPIIGVRTDLRGSGDDGSFGTNLMLSNCCAETVRLSAEGDVESAAREIAAALRRCLPQTLSD